MNKIKSLSSKIKFRSGLKISSIIVISILVGITAVYAGTLTPPGGASDTMYSLTDIFNLSTGTTTDEGTGTIPTTPSLSETGKTLTEVYDAISTEVAKLSSSVIASGTTAFGITGSDSVVDTSDADATEDDIITGKTAYVNGEKVTGTATAGSAGGLTKTGQTQCNEYSDNYNTSSQVDCTGTNQDGEAQRGLAKSYTDNGDGTVTDNNTGLMWQKCTNGQTGLDCSGGSAETLLFDDGNGVSPAINYCENLSLATHTDWHLPNINELQSLVDYGRVNPAIDPAFPLTQSDYYWSSTAYEDNADGAWIVSFYDGNVSIDSMNTSYFVRCVRE